MLAKTGKRMMAWGLAAGLLLSAWSAASPQQADAAVKVKVKSVKVTNVKKKKVTLKKGKSITLKTKVTVKPNKAKYKKVNFRSSNKKVATVSGKGKVKAVKAGKAKITVTSRRNKKKKTVITVTVKAATGDSKGGTQGNNNTPTPSQKNDGTGTQTATPTPEVTATPTSSPTPTPIPDGTSTLMRKPFAEQAKVGQKLADLPVKSGSIQDSNGAEIEGTYEWEQPDTLMEKSGKSHHKVKFIPKDSSFAKIENISLPVHTMKNQVTIYKTPRAGAVKTGSKLGEIALTGGTVRNDADEVVSGKFSWAEPDLLVKKPGKTRFMVVFTPDDTVTYRTETIYLYVTVSGTAVTDTEPDRKLDLTGAALKNEEAYVSAWNGSFYNIRKYLSGIDLSRYTSLSVTAKLYDKSSREITDTNSLYVGYKLANRDGDWSGFSDAYVNRTGTLSLSGYEGGDLYLVVQNFSADVAYIEISSMTLKAEEITNVMDGSSLKLAFGDIFGKVGCALVGHQMTNKNCVDFTKTHYNSITMGNEMKPEHLMGGTPNLEEANPAGYVDPSKFTYKYKDTKYPVINMDSIDRYMETAYANGLKMRFHVFVWHKQTPRWFFKKNFDTNEGYVSPDVMSGRLEYLVRNVMTHIYSYQNKDGVYIGREVMDNWDMANEYMHNNDGNVKNYWDEVYYPDYKLDKNKHSGILKPVYIKQAFAIGHSILEDFKLTDQVSLMYNDYNTYMVAENIVKMIQYINTKDEINPDGEVICDGVGMQTHLDIGYPTIDNVSTSAIEIFKEAGFEIQFTEIDMTDYTQTEKSQNKQIAKWYNLMMLLVCSKDSGAKITGITWWGPSDNFSWRSDGVPLLFSVYWQAKEHYFEVIDSVNWFNQGDTEGKIES